MIDCKTVEWSVLFFLQKKKKKKGGRKKSLNIFLNVKIISPTNNFFFKVVYEIIVGSAFPAIP
jgi:hypothetical protein